MPVSVEDFIRIWQASDNVGEVSKKVGMGPQTCSSKAYNLRKQGVNLKRFPTSPGKRLDFARLNEIANEELNESDKPTKTKASKPKPVKSSKDTKDTKDTKDKTSEASTDKPAK